MVILDDFLFFFLFKKKKKNRFIEKYGTHIVVGVTMGGKDVVHMKQLRNSNHEADDVQRQLKHLADKRFSAESNSPVSGSPSPLPFGFNGPFGSSVGRPLISRSKNEVCFLVTS